MKSEKQLIDVAEARGYVETFLADPILKMAANAVLNNTPRVDAVEVVHGRWIDNIDENGYLCNAWRKCSACGGLNYSKRPPYCPNCGAKMDGDEGD